MVERSRLLAGTIAGVFAFMLAFGAAHAQPAPPPITDNRYGIDLYQGPVTTASRVIGLAGAYTALAEWCEGEYANAASPAVRAPYSRGARDFDVCLGVSSPSGSDLENRGLTPRNLGRFTSAVTLNLGLEVQYSSFGVTLNYDQVLLTLDGDTAAPTRVIVHRVIGSFATSFADGQLLVGVGFRALGFGLDRSQGSSYASVLSAPGVNIQYGAIWRPRGRPFRLGGTMRPQIVADDPHDRVAPGEARSVAGYVLPSRITAPWELELGGALELGRRPFNPARIDVAALESDVRARYDRQRLARAGRYRERLARAPTQEREALRRRLEREELGAQEVEDAAMDREIAGIVANVKAQSELWDRHRMTLLGGVLITGAVEQSVAISAFVAQRNVPSGARAVVSPRLAFETELVRDWLTGRGGTYLEPARQAGGSARGHFTLGADLRLIRFNPLGLFGDDPWQVRLAGDVGPRYFNWALAIGKYH